MASAVKVIGISAAVAIGVWGLAKLAKTGNDAMVMLDTFDFELGVSNFKVTASKISCKLRLDIINPTDLPLTVRKPYVEVFFNEAKSRTKIASSKTSSEEVIILPCTKSTIEFDIESSTLTAITTIAKIIKMLFAGTKDQATLADKVALISQNYDKVYSMFSVKVLTYWNGIAINKEFTL